MEMILNTVRLMDNDEDREMMFDDEGTMKERIAIAFLNPEDFEELYMTKSLKLHVKSEFGEINVYNERDEEIPRGTLVMPISIWSNQLTGTREGKLFNKGIKVEVEASRDEPPSFSELISKIKEK